MQRKGLLIVVDPLPANLSVQFNQLASLLRLLQKRFDLSIYANYIAEDKINCLHSFGCSILKKKDRRFPSFIKRVFYHRFNESFLWGINWFLDVLMFKLGLNVEDKLGREFDYVVNLSSTIVCKSDVLWIQGPPFFEVVDSMSSHNFLARIFMKVFRHPLENGSRLIISNMATLSNKVVANSKFTASRFDGFPFKIDAVIYNSQEFADFAPPLVHKKNKYVLTYIGKETDVDTLLRMSDAGIRVVGFGAKVPPGFNLGKLKSKIEFLGNVTREELVRLYGNAFFVAFPFTNEPFGFIPIESMLCGTPVLSFDKEGPSETIIDGVTGWLAESCEDFLNLATSIWHKKETGIAREACIKRGKEFTSEVTVIELSQLIVPVPTNEISSYN